MFDTMTLTKIAAGVFGAWLVLLLGKWAGEEIYHADAHGEASYVIEVADAGGDEAPKCSANAPLATKSMAQTPLARIWTALLAVTSQRSVISATPVRCLRSTAAGPRKS